MDWIMVAALLVALLVGGVFAYIVAYSRFQADLTKQQLAAQENVSGIMAQQAITQEKLGVADGALLVAREELVTNTQLIEEYRIRLSDQTSQLASLKTELAQQQVAQQKEKALFDETKGQMSNEFERLANRIFEEKTSRFSQSSKEALDTALNPLKAQITDFKSKVEDVYDKESRDRVSLATELGQLKKLNVQMSEDAINLTRALKGDNKVQGNWGEVILERVLEESGLRKGHEYDTQVNLSHADGQRRNPDVIVRLPEQKDIVIDSKVSLLDYERYCNAESDEDKQQALKQHARSVRAHIHGLSLKAYESLESIRSLDFVFIFIPIESAFMAAFEYDQTIFKEAYEKNIIVVGPTTLLATLRTVQSIWRYERQNKNAEEIARQAGAMHDKFVNFIEDMNKIAHHLAKAGEAHAGALNKLSRGRGNLVNNTLKLEKLGAKVKKVIPQSVLSNTDELNDSQAEALIKDTYSNQRSSEH